MKNHSPSESDTRDGTMLRLAERNLSRVLRELDAIIGELEARSAGADGRVKSVTVDVRKAIQTVFDERQRIEKLNEKNADSGTGGALDLEAARAEVGRRLARLRDRGGAGTVSQQPQ